MNQFDRAEIVKLRKEVTANRRALVAMTNKYERIERLLEHFLKSEEAPPPPRSSAAADAAQEGLHA